MKRLACIGFLALAACSAPRSPHDLAAGERTVRVDDDRVYGATADISKIGNEYRGTWNGHIVLLQTDGARVQGVIGRMPLDVSIQQGDGTLALTGVVNGAGTNLTLTDESIHGSLSRCDFDMKKSDGIYDGGHCGTPWLRLPDNWNQLSAADRGTYLVLMLASC